jgi:hypothetical protein
MIISATLINSQGCEFDSVTFHAPWGVKDRDAASLAKAKRWACQRGGHYTLHVDKEVINGGWLKTIGEYRYSGKCVRGVAL